MKKLEKNMVVKQLEIIDYTHEGLGVGKLDNFPIFIEFAKIGQKYDVSITKVEKKFGFGRILNDSESNDCQYYKLCGGCQIRHLTYNEQLEFKTNVVKNIFNKNKLDINVNNIIKADDTNQYRNKIMMPVSTVDKKITSGYYQKRSHNVVPIDSCLLASDLVNEVVKEVDFVLNQVGETVFNPKTKKGNIRHVYIREGKNTNEIMVCFIAYHNYINKQKDVVKYLTSKFSEIKSIVINQNTRFNSAVLGFKNYNLYNSNFITEKIGDLEFRLEPNTFFQINTVQMEKLYDEILRLLDPKETDVVLDAFCGVGTITSYVSKHVEFIYGVEINPKSIKSAKINKDLNNITNMDFLAEDINVAVEELSKVNFSKVIIDPPRNGLDDETIDFLNNQKFEKVIYVSCNPATLARDLNKLQNIYEVKQVTPVDMFPNTYHVECVCELVLKG